MRMKKKQQRWRFSEWINIRLNYMLSTRNTLYENTYKLQVNKGENIPY